MPRRKKRKKSKKTFDSVADFDNEILKSLAKECKIKSWSTMLRSTLIDSLKPYYRNEQQIIDALNAHREPNNIEMQEKKPKSQFIHSFDRRPNSFKSMKVYEHSHTKLQKIKQKYAYKNKKRVLAKSKITPMKPLNNEQMNNSQTRKQYLWSHLIPNDILKMIFMKIDTNAKCNGDKTVLTLVKICKHWRNIIHQNEDDENFHSHMWYGCIKYLGSFSNPFDWKYLASIPDEYLKIITNISVFQEMNIDENKLYRTLSKCDFAYWESCHDQRCDASFDPQNEEMLVVEDSNIPLIIATLSKCPNICSLSLRGWLCKDIFFAIAESCNGLQELDFNCTEHGKYRWLDIFTEPQYAPVISTVKYMSIYRSYWVDTEVMFIISRFHNLVSLSAERLNLGGFALSYLFGSARKLEYIQLDRCFGADEDLEEWDEAFRRLARYCKVVRSISFDECYGFDDGCLKRLMGKNACPQLEELCLNYHSCSDEMISKFKKAKRTVQFSDHSL